MDYRVGMDEYYGGSLGGWEMDAKRQNDYKTAMGIIAKLSRETEDSSVKEALSEANTNLFNARIREEGFTYAQFRETLGQVAKAYGEAFTSLGNTLLGKKE